MDADGFDISLPKHFLSKVMNSELGNKIIQWSCLFNSHLCTMETKYQRTEDKETMLCLSIRPSGSKPGRSVTDSKTLKITISNIEENDQMQSQLGRGIQIHNTGIKRKRGRPRKSEPRERTKAILPEINGRRYSLRGVKIADSIMNAEKGIECETVSSLEADGVNMDSSLCGVVTVDFSHLECEDNLEADLQKTAMEISNENEIGIHPQEVSDNTVDHPSGFDLRKIISDKLETEESNDDFNEGGEDSLESSNKANYCHKCKKAYKNFQTLKNHIKYVHKTYGQKNHCKLCPAKFKHLSVLKQHVDEIHHKKISFTCEVCKKEFARRNQYNRHMLCHQDESRHLKCPHCEKGFSFKYNLTRHIELIHKPSTESFHCSYCGKGFNLKAAMVSHVQQVHFNIYPFQCSIENCKMGFSRQKQLVEHMQQSHSDVAFQPPQYTRGRYKYGRTEEDLFFCSHCRVSFCYKAKLVEHMHFAHNDAFPYVCTECSQGFVEKSYLLHHLKYAHNHTIDNKSIEETDTEDEDHPDGKSNYKIIMVDETGEVLQICQPINKETSAALEVNYIKLSFLIFSNYNCNCDGKQSEIRYTCN